MICGTRRGAISAERLESRVAREQAKRDWQGPRELDGILPARAS